ncbi:MAG: sulfite exporter TauE/SafE family protein [Clostridia bacterium]|nr:sulfite exporter TauE/SafE family protein [Clostridia bacterium]
MDTVVWMIATFVAFFVKGLCGFANTLVFQSILSFQNDNKNISPVELILTYPANIILMLKERKSLKWSVCLPLTVLVVLGSIPGILLLKSADTTVIKIIFGIVTVIVAVEMYFRMKREKSAEESTAEKILMYIVGLISGVLCGLYGVGALLGAFVGRKTDTLSAFKANMSFIFVVENTLRLVLYIVLKILNLEILKKALIMIPFMFGGLLLGMFASKFVNEKLAKKIIILALIVSGISLVVTSIL